MRLRSTLSLSAERYVVIAKLEHLNRSVDPFDRDRPDRASTDEVLHR